MGEVERHDDMFARAMMVTLILILTWIGYALYVPGRPLLRAKQSHCKV